MEEKIENLQFWDFVNGDVLLKRPQMGGPPEAFLTDMLTDRNKLVRLLLPNIFSHFKRLIHGSLQKGYKLVCRLLPPQWEKKKGEGRA